MKYSAAIFGIAAIFATAYATSQSAGPMEDDKMGLSRTSVYDDPSPETFQYPQTDPSAAVDLPRSWDSAPPQIPHETEAFLPIKIGKNKCIVCHDKTAMIGKKKIKGLPTPMPESHYVKAEDGKLTQSGARYNCTQCHAPQAEVSDLVGNTFTTAH
jgi:cytochrome c-type protein NapB